MITHALACNDDSQQSRMSHQALARIVPQIKEELVVAIDIFNSVKLW